LCTQFAVVVGDFRFGSNKTEVSASWVVSVLLSKNRHHHRPPSCLLGGSFDSIPVIADQVIKSTLASTCGNIEFDQ
jgi:hypothetical protein